MRSHTRARSAVRWAVACVALTMVMASCSDDDDASSDDTSTTAATESSAATDPSESTADETTSPGAAAGDEQICADREALSTAVDALGDVDVVAEGTNGVTAAAADVSTALAALQESAGDELQPQVEDVQDAIAELETAAAEIDSEGAVPALNAVADVATSAATLLASLDDGACG